MIKYFDGQITDILPRNLTQEPAAQAYSAAVREGTRLLYKYTQLRLLQYRNGPGAHYRSFGEGAPDAIL